MISTPFTLYQTSTGRILTSGTSFNAQSLAGEGQGVLIDKTTHDLSTSYVEKGKIRTMPPSPGEYHKWDYENKLWCDPRTPETEWPLVRAKREKLLATTDWSQLPDVPLHTRTAWLAYRQALRDITNQPDPLTIVWPQPPA